MLSWIPFLPFVGFLINGCWYAFGQARQAPSAHGAAHGNGHGGHSHGGLSRAVVSGTIGSLAIGGAFVISLVLFLKLLGMPAEERVIEQTLFSWMQVGDLNLNVTFRIDVLSSLFALVITGVGTLIHIYSIGYMGHDETPGKYFAYLNLFCFSMLVLVLGGSMPMLFLGWEGVGLCSYLLIGYWYEDDEKASAGKKAFIVNRIGDLGFLLGMFLIYTTFGTLDFLQLKAVVTSGQVVPAAGVLTAIGLLLFVGCAGKSAQIPLYVWLPDAMAGPTPVSALIHAATMVTSGIYLVSRLSFIYALTPTALSVVAWVGALTALFAATMAIAQRDIKKVLAYSTVSQLGYMFLACGVGAFSAGVFHVITHAFFKALLFLGAGSVIYGMHHEQDILKMGGLRKYMPRTFFVFAVAWLAICGIPPFSGFFSKDEILWKSFASVHGSTLLWAVGAITAVMTAFYMTRLFSLTFLGKPRFESGGQGHSSVHESPMVMVAPLLVLAVLSFAGGFMGIPHMSWLEHWLHPILPAEQFKESVSHSMEWVLMALSVVGAGVGIFLGLRTYQDFANVARLQQKYPGIYKLFYNKWYVDEIYEAAVVQPMIRFSRMLWKWVDIGVIDRTVLGFGRVSEWTGQTLRYFQTGSVQAYAVLFLVGLVVTVGYLIYGLV